VITHPVGWFLPPSPVFPTPIPRRWGPVAGRNSRPLSPAYKGHDPIRDGFASWCPHGDLNPGTPSGPGAVTSTVTHHIAWGRAVTVAPPAPHRPGGCQWVINTTTTKNKNKIKKILLLARSTGPSLFEFFETPSLRVQVTTDGSVHPLHLLRSILTFGECNV